MPYFSSPTASDFYDDRILISWKITQPSNLPPLKNLVFKIKSEPKVTFIPLQSDLISLPELDNNKIIINWVIQKPTQPTKVDLSVECDSTTENHQIIINRSFT